MQKKSGFTLIELVVVVLILGILAGVAAPKFLNTSKEATDSGLKQTLAIVRDAIEIYTAKNGTLPPCDVGGSTFRSAMAPYIRGSFPISPGGTEDDEITPTNVAGTTVPDNGTGWMYNTADGTFICNDPAYAGF